MVKELAIKVANPDNEVTSLSGGNATSDLDELMALSDRIAVLSNGKLIGMFNREEATEAKVIAASAKGHGPATSRENAHG